MRISRKVLVYETTFALREIPTVRSVLQAMAQELTLCGEQLSALAKKIEAVHKGGQHGDADQFHHETDRQRPGELVHLSPAQHIGRTEERPPKQIRVSPRGVCLLYTSPSPRDRQKSRMPSSA